MGVRALDKEQRSGAEGVSLPIDNGYPDPRDDIKPWVAAAVALVGAALGVIDCQSRRPREQNAWPRQDATCDPIEANYSCKLPPNPALSGDRAPD